MSKLRLLLIGVGAFIVLLPFILVMSFISAIPAWLLWNWVGPIIFHAHPLPFLPVWGLLLLLHIIGGAFRSTITVKADR